MKISFRARFRDDKWKDIYNQEKLHDAFLIFLPKKLEISPIDSTTFRYYEIKVQTDQANCLAEIKKKLERLGIRVSNVSHIKSEFTKEELKEIKKMVCFEEIFKRSE